MRRTLLFAAIAIIAAATSQIARAGDGSAGSVVYILDCSSSMGDEIINESPVREASVTAKRTRLAVAKEMLHKLVADAVQNDYKVGLMLYGHRLAWADDSETPDVMEQGEYFAKTGNYEALMSLIPGEDVERIQSLKRMESQDLLAMTHRLDAVQAWGEKPLYLALIQATAELSTEPLGDAKSIVVLTAGGNQQRLANTIKSYSDVQAALERRRIAVSFIDFGSENDRDTHTDLQAIAKATRGKVAPAIASDEQVSFATLVMDEVEQPATAPEAGQAAMVSTATMPARPREQLLEGVVLYYGKPVSRATVRLETSSAGEIQTDKEGRFKFLHVTPGTYTVAVRAIAKNKIKEKNIDIIVEDLAKRETFVTIDVK